MKNVLKKALLAMIGLILLSSTLLIVFEQEASLEEA
jgi:hypothetical protein